MWPKVMADVFPTSRCYADFQMQLHFKKKMDLKQCLTNTSQIKNITDYHLYAKVNPLKVTQF